MDTVLEIQEEISKAPAVEPNWLKVEGTNGATRYSSLSRSKIYQLLEEGKIRSVCLRAKDKQRGTRLIFRPSLGTYLAKFEGVKSEQSPRPQGKENQKWNPQNKCGALLHAHAPSQTGTVHNCHDGCSCQAQVLTISETRAIREESATTTLPNDQIDYVSPLNLTVRHSDHELQQAWRDETHAVYKHFGAHGQFIGWESIRIKVKPETKIFGKVYPKREVYPANEDFARYALSVGAQYDLKYAIAKAKTLKIKFRRKDRHNQNWNRYGDVLEQEQVQTETETQT